MTEAMPESSEGVHSQRVNALHSTRATFTTLLYTQALNTRGIVNAALAMQDERPLVHRGAQYSLHHLYAADASTHPMTPTLCIAGGCVSTRVCV